MSAPTIELETGALADGVSCDRPSFQAQLRRGLSGVRVYQVFASQKALLFLDLGTPAELAGGPGTTGFAGGMIGGLLGGIIGAKIGSAIHRSLSEINAPANPGRDYTFYSDDELISLAKKRRKSFVALYDDISRVSIEGPGMFDRMFEKVSLQGWITIRERTVGKVKLELHQASEMATAIDAFASRMKDRVTVKARFDRTSRRYIALGG